MEDLTKKNQEIAFQARKAKWEGKIMKTWTEDGTIFVKKTEDGAPIRVVNRSFLDELPEVGQQLSNQRGGQSDRN